MNRYIDAEFALLALRVFSDKKNGNPHFLNAIETAKEIIEELPAADVRENIHSGWGWDNYKYDWICLNCGEPSHIRKDENDAFGKPICNFCSNCGADMRGEK